MPKISVITPVCNAEKHLEAMLRSVKKQTLREFEVLAVNCGSTDGSQEIIDRYCREDSRFISVNPEAPGISAARNAGLDKATSEYVVFVDSDDLVPESGLKDLYDAAKKEFADMVIGLPEIRSVDAALVPEGLSQLTAKSRIDRYDPDLNRTFDARGKLFRREVIEKNSLRFLPLRYGADGVFTYAFEQCCESITGCNSVIYTQMRRLPGKDDPMTENLPAEDVRALLEAFDAIEDIVERTYEATVQEMETKGAQDNELAELASRYKIFFNDMLARFAGDSLLGGFYRYIWKLDDETISLIETRTAEYNRRIFPGVWERQVNGENPDLALHKKILLHPEEIAADPLVSVVVSAGVSGEQAGALVASLYNQNFPSFEVIVDAALTKQIDETWKSKINFSELSHEDNTSNFKKNAMKSLKGTYVTFVDEPIVYSWHILRDMFREITRKTDGPNFWYISMPLRHMEGETSREMECSNAVFINELVKIKLRSFYNQMDYFWCNKIFHVAYLKGKRVLFTGDARTDIAKLYNNATYVKTPHLSMVTSMDERDVMRRVKSPWVRLNYRRKLRQDRRIRDLIARQDIRIETFRQKFKKWRQDRARKGFRFITLKIIYPLYYKWNTRKPVDKKKIIFIEPRMDKLSNSVQQIYDYVSESGKYVVHEHYLRQRYARFRIVFKNSLAFLKDFATAKYAVIPEADQTLSCMKKRKETVVVNTWHGCGAFKKFGFSTADKLFGSSMKIKLRYPLYNNLDIVTVSSPDVVWAYEEAMLLKGKGIVQPLGISRTDVFFDEDYVNAAVERVHEAVPQSRDKKIIFYAPTFRGRIASAAGPNMLDLERMAEELSDEYILIIKHHPLVKTPPVIRPGVKDKFAFDMTRTGSIDDLICASDICISDYSSLVYEYSLFERPMLFFAYDLNDYFDWRGFYYDYEELTPGPVVTSTEEIIHYIKNVDTLFDKKAVQDFRERFMSSCDGHSTERIIKAMETR